MKKSLAAALLLTASLSMSANASLISGSITFDGGKPVNLQGLEWMPLTYTAGLSRADVEAGFTDANKLWGAGGWRYATRTETEVLLGSFWGGRFDGWSRDNYEGAAEFLALFGELHSHVNGVERTTANHFFFGQDGDCNESATQTCYGTVIAISGASGFNQGAYDKLSDWEFKMPAPEINLLGMFHDATGLDAGRIDRNIYFSKSTRFGDTGSLLVRMVDTPVGAVSSPSVLSIFALGLCGLMLSRRKIAA